WDHERFEYLARVDWSSGSPLTIVVQSRDQRTIEVLEVEDTTGATSTVIRDEDPIWLELIDGSPSRLPDGRLVTTADRDDRRRVGSDGQVASPGSLPVRGVMGAGDDGVWFGASSGDEPMETHVFRVGASGDTEPITTGPGVHTAVTGDGVAAVIS